MKNLFVYFLKWIVSREPKAIVAIILVILITFALVHVTSFKGVDGVSQQVYKCNDICTNLNDQVIN